MDKRRIKRLEKFFITNIGWIQIIIMVLVLMFIIVNDFEGENSIDSMKIFQINVTTLFSALTVEFIIFCWVYSINQRENEVVLSRVKKLLDNSPFTSLIDRENFNVLTELKKAKNDAFISGSALTVLLNGQALLSTWPKGIKLKIVSLNIGNQQQLEEFCGLFGPVSTVKELRDVLTGFYTIRERVKNNGDIEYRVASFVTPIVFVAVDIMEETENTFIMAQHYLHAGDGAGNYISIMARPGSDLYLIYKEQIKIILATSLNGDIEWIKYQAECRLNIETTKIPNI